MGLTLYRPLRMISRLGLSLPGKKEMMQIVSEGTGVAGGRGNDNRYKVTGICHSCVSRIPGTPEEKSLVLN